MHTFDPDRSVSIETRQDYLGPAEVTRIGPQRVGLRKPSGEEVNASMALALPYEPALGDLLLLTSSAHNHYVIGVLNGRGRVKLEVAGDVSIHAAGGSLSLTADKGIQLRSPEVAVQSDRFSVFAKSAITKFTTWYQNIREMLHVRAGETHTVVDQTAVQQARRIAIVAEETASVNGQQITLG